MKKLLSYAVLGLVSAFVLVGCKPKEPDTMPSGTNAPVTTNATPTTP